MSDRTFAYVFLVVAALGFVAFLCSPEPSRTTRNRKIMSNPYFQLAVFSGIGAAALMVLVTPYLEQYAVLKDALEGLGDFFNLPTIISVILLRDAGQWGVAEEGEFEIGIFLICFSALYLAGWLGRTYQVHQMRQRRSQSL